ncbi:Uncharacterized protein YraP [Candidatus Providencia siddallii]|uniref:Uncharacterized protein YraP n=1 Tax=Candidatus Providencia siddallii TaxID=1715285 RepID=A0A0M6WA25_9GAMM|nr:Uncharacterized protein YraP [Candidatus Providencia siddallii]
MKFIAIFNVMLLVILSQGCISATVIGSAAVATRSATDSRTIIQQVDDNVLEARINGKLNKNKDIIKKTRIIVTAYKGIVLLTGQSPYLFLSERAKQIATSTKGASVVYNEIRSEFPVDLGIASKDAWITAIVKSKILASDKIKLGNVKVITENGEVFLLGVVTKQEAEDVAKIASSIKDVRRVTTVFNYLNY